MLVHRCGVCGIATLQLRVVIEVVLHLQQQYVNCLRVNFSNDDEDL
jgi:hypothetical protein